MRVLVFLSLSVYFLFANQLIIDANKFEAYDEKGVSIFSGNVKLKRINDTLQADRLEVFITKANKGKQREPEKYIAVGNVSFKVVTNGKEYEGKGDKVVYEPKKMQYVITGNGYLKEKLEDKTLYGEKIYINQETGEAKVSGSENQPVRFIINLDDNTSEKKEQKKDELKDDIQKEEAQ